MTNTPEFPSSDAVEPALPESPYEPEAAAEPVPAVPEKTKSEIRADEKAAKKAADQAAKAAEKAAEQAAKDAEKARKEQEKRERANPVGWSAVLLAVVAMASQAFLLNFSVATGTAGAANTLRYNPPGLLWDPSNAVASAMLLVALITALAAIVVAIVALASKKKPVWISMVSIGVGLAVLVGTVSFWQAAATL